MSTDHVPMIDAATAPSAGTEPPYADDNAAPTGRSPVSARFRQLLRLAKGVGFVMLLALIGYGIILVQNQADALARRAPTLEYMACHDRRQDRTLEETFVFLDKATNSVGSTDVVAPEDVRKARNEWRAAREDLAKATDADSAERCPQLPIGDLDDN